MRSTRFAVIVMVLLLALTFALSAPVLSVEDPWDVDILGGETFNGGGGRSATSGTEPVADSTMIGSGRVQGACPTPGPSVGLRCEWWQSTIVKASYRFVVRFSPRFSGHQRATNGR